MLFLCRNKILNIIIIVLDIIFQIQPPNAITKLRIFLSKSLEILSRLDIQINVNIQWIFLVYDFEWDDLQNSPYFVIFFFQ